MSYIGTGAVGSWLCSPFLDMPFAIYGQLLNNCFWKCIWEYTGKHHIKLKWAGQTLPKPQWEGDIFIMEALVDAGVWGAMLVFCNRVWLLMQAITLADIATGDGMGISKQAQAGHQMALSRWIWVAEHPSNTNLEQWQTCLQLISSSEYQFSIWDQLGKWFTDNTQSVWPWLYCPDDHCLYTHRYGGWHQFSHQGHTRYGVISGLRLGPLNPQIFSGLKSAWTLGTGHAFLAMQKTSLLQHLPSHPYRTLSTPGTFTGHLQTVTSHRTWPL